MSMTRDEAMKLMTEGAFQQEREAAGKWVRASLSSTQLLSYFTGYEEHRRLRAEAEQRLTAVAEKIGALSTLVAVNQVSLEVARAFGAADEYFW